MKLFRLDVGEKFFLGQLYQNNGWKRLTLFHEVKRWGGGSTSTPVAEIDVVDHPSRDRCNPHTEIQISVRNDGRLRFGGIDIDGNKSRLRHPDDVLGKSTVINVVTKLKEAGIATDPLCVYVSMRHNEDFWVEGDFWDDR
jgi:hypothetical protein